MKEKTNIRFGIRTDDEDHNKIQQTQTSNYYFCRCNKQDELQACMFSTTTEK